MTRPEDASQQLPDGGSDDRRLTTEPLDDARNGEAGELHARLMERLGPPSILVNKDCHVVHLAGGAGRFLQFTNGQPTASLPNLVHPALQAELHAALLQAGQTGAVREMFGLPMEMAGKKYAVNIRVIPARDLAPDHLLVTLESTEVAPDSALPMVLAPGMNLELMFRQKERELEQTRAQLRETTEISAASTEELRASNEELHSLVEELRATTEQLENSRNDFESANTRLSTANQELLTTIDEREAADAGRRDSESRFRQFFNQASDAAFVHDLDGRFVDVNDMACTALGYSRDELLKMSVADVAVNFIPSASRRFWRKMAPGSVEKIESRHRRKDGSTFPVEIHASVLDTSEGRRLLAFVRDVTARKLTEELVRVQARNQAAVARLGSRALSGGGVDDLLQEAVVLVGQTLDIEICRVHEHLPERGVFIVKASLDPSERGMDTKISKDDDISFARYALHATQPVIVNDVDEEIRFELSPLLRRDRTKSFVCIVIGGTAPGSLRFGLLGLASRQKRGFTDEDVTFAQSVANILASAVDRRRKEDELRVVEARYQRIAAHTPGVVYQYVLRPDGSVEIPFISEGCRAIYGKEPREIQDDPSLMLAAVHLEDRARLEKAMRVAETTLTPLHWQGRHFLPDGEICWVRLDSQPERLPDGSVICDGIVINVTAEEKRKEALRQSEERFRLAIVHSPFPCMLHADDGEILQVNEAWTHMTGYRPEQLSTLEDWIALAYASKRYQEHIRGFLAEMANHIGAVESAGQRIRCVDGGECIWDFSCANLGLLPDGRWLRISTAIDVTARRQAEIALRAAKEEAEHANRAKSEFLSRVSHELRTPLNAILGFGQLLDLSGDLGKEDHSGVQHILKGGRHLLGLIDEVLDLSRVETGELHLVFGKVDADQLMRECVALVANLARLRGVTCQVKKSRREEAFVWGDAQRLRQMLLNLLSNAIKYNRQGGQVRLEVQRTPSGKLRLRVSDTGPGISAEEIARLFVPFERLGQEHGEIEGTGLGLVVSRALAEAMHGSLGVESKVGHGSTFWIELPAAPDQTAEDAAIDEPAELANSGAVAVPSNVTVLYVEDNASNLQLVKMLLANRRPHWKFLSARDGVAGWEQARSFRPDLILLDLQLPSMSGDEVLTEIRRDPATRHIPVILLSADATTYSRERLLESGANEYISKPFQLEDLLERLDQALRDAAGTSRGGES